MAETFNDIKGAIVIMGRVQAKPGKGDEVAQFLANLRARANSDAEPGTLLYEIVRWGDEFGICEKYADQAAIAAHRSELLTQFQHSGLFDVKDKGIFFPADSLPPPNI